MDNTYAEETKMSVGFKQALGIHPLALNVRDRRTEVLASNLANADTPGYKARDLDFRAVLNGVRSDHLPLATTHPEHRQPPALSQDSGVLYRVPAQPSLDGNTVESEQEHIRYAENALQYQATLRFLGDDFAGLKTAITGQ
jgi:flagellar basal-body rod protein FlgB